ncbi:MAG: hypothetical protein Q8P45_03355 [Candidatus Harrisonbacteria bacterium]|nr:hypothetical protein [Candidatus Harrisonbacteria bacterium]
MKKALIVLIIIIIVLLLVWWLLPSRTVAPDADTTPLEEVADDENFEGLSDQELEAEFEALDADIEAL